MDFEQENDTVKMAEKEELAQIETDRNEYFHAKHYQGKNGLDVLTVIDAFDMNTFLEGNIVKYVLRYKQKGKPIDDLTKAKAYIDLLIDKLKREESTVEDF